MKRASVFLGLLFLLALTPLAPARTSLRAHAEGERYAVAAERNVWFYSDETEGSGLFILPYTYYVKVVSEGDIFCAVEYLCDSLPYRKIRGYCKKSALTFVDFVPERPWLFREITVSYSLPSEYAALGNGSFERVEQTFVYYGHRYEQNRLFFYVAKDGAFDYIPASEELTYDLNTDYLPDEETEAGAANGISAVHVVVICLVCVAAVVIAIIVMRGKRPTAEPRELSDF